MQKNGPWIRAMFFFPVLLMPVLGGCGGGGSTSSNGNTTLTGPDPTILTLSATTPAGLTVTLPQDKATIPVGSTANYTLTVVNSSAAPVSFLTTNQNGTSTPLVPASLTVLDASGATVYALPAPATTVTDTLQPGDSLTQTVALTNVLTKVARYQATAVFQTGPPSTSVGPLVITAR